MNKTKWTAGLALGLMLAAGLNRLVADDTKGSPDAATPKVAIEQLSFLAGNWSGTFPGGRWESAYTTPDGGMILSASKEFRGDKIVMIEFEHFYTVEGEVVVVPFPFGKKSSVSFKLSEFDEAKNRVVFANPEHDFPNKLIYERTKPNELVIQVIGTMRDKEVNQTMTLARVGNED
ncbi:MAG: hypothetical protein DHS20C16_05540 [Phycisphaerae bacterium]|nr:MAG: hypothetical protein DHS20C16_05540 [Phycisphaerae bacterium]